MKHCLFLGFFVVCFLCQSFLGFSHSVVIYPICDSKEFKLPRNMRTTLQINIDKPMLTIEGLNRLKMSGSGQFSEPMFKTMVESLSISPKKLIVLDLRQESHGFINGTPVSWTDGNNNYANIQKTKPEIESDEYQRLRLAIQAQQIVLDPLEKPNKLVVYTARTERELVESYGATYIRLPVTDHNHPSDEIIDQFLALIHTLPADAWIHTHCKGGRGRTTTFLTLYDIVKNSRFVSLEDILKRQHLIGGVDLADLSKKDVERLECQKNRLKFIQKFYLYCRQVPDFQMTWSEWSNRQQILLVNNP